MKRSAPSVVFVLSVDILLLFAEHEPVEAHDDEVADDGHGVEEVVSGLHVDSSVRSLEAVFSKVSDVVRSTDAADQGDGGEHQGPVSERDEEAVPVHIEAISHIAHSGATKHQISHPLGCVDFALLSLFLLCRKILELS